MKILSIDSSAKAASVCLCEDETILGEFFINTKLTHSETLMPMVSALMSSTKYKLQDIDVFAVSAGPGSFTGVRIGISAVKGMSFALNKPCVVVSTLEAMAYNFSDRECLVLSAMDARREQVYNAIFRANNGKVERLTEDRAISIEQLKKEVESEYNEENIIFVGDGADLCYNSFDKDLFSIRLSPEHLRYQRASGVSRVALNKISEWDLVSSEELRPIYLRQSQAERLRSEQIKRETNNQEGEL